MFRCVYRPSTSWTDLGVTVVIDLAAPDVNISAYFNRAMHIWWPISDGPMAAPPAANLQKAL